MKLPPRIGSLYSRELRGRLLSLRRDLHRHPELSFREGRTARKLEEELGLLRPLQLDRIAGTGVLARIKGRTSGAPTVVVRGDIDALPIGESTGLEWASENPGVMHACGHDVHATWAIGAAHLLAASPAEGDVLVLLQPAEEIGQGARTVLQSGVLDGASAIVGGHVDRGFVVGEVVAQEGPLAASADTFTIKLIGKGGHGARPHESADPIVGAAALIGSLQTIVSRRLDPARPSVVTVGTIQAGSAPNIIPEEAHLAGTLRTTEPASRRFLQEEVGRMAESTALMYGLQAVVEVEEGTPPIVNPAEPVSWARGAVAELLGEDALVPLGTLNLGGEDFAFYMERIPGCFLRIGAREPGGPMIPAHSSAFFAADEAIFIGAAVLAQTARTAAARLSSS